MSEFLLLISEIITAGYGKKIVNISNFMGDATMNNSSDFLLYVTVISVVVVGTVVVDAPILGVVVVPAVVVVVATFVVPEVVAMTGNENVILVRVLDS